MKEKNNIKRNSNFFITTMLSLALISSLAYFIVIFLNTKRFLEINTIINLSLLTIFTILFVATGIVIGKRGRTSTLLASITIIIFNLFNIASSYNLISFRETKLDNFTNKSLTEVIKYAEKNNLSIKQTYEYSDMIEEYSIISQNLKEGTNLKDIKGLTVAISEGPNPDKEVVIPNMLTWEAETVLNFVKENFLTNVQVEFVESSKVKDTVIEQDKTGNLRRSDEIKLTFSLGEGSEIESTKLIDLTNKTEFEAIFWLKQHAIKYETEKDFSSKIKRGNVLKQDKKMGIIIKPNDKTVKLTISKGPKIKVPDLTKMSMTEITEWIIKNKLKISFTDKYDENVKDNMVIEASYKKNDIVEQKTLINVVISKGKLVMPKIKSLAEFKEWAEKYKIKYQEEYEFSDTISKGEVISYSHNEKDTIKNEDTIIIKISNGKKVEVPKLTGLKKADIISKLKKLNLNYNFIYKYDNNTPKDTAIAQSMAPGSNIAEETTITITLSNGKKPASSNSNSGNSGGSNNPGNSGDSNQPTCEQKSYTISRELNAIFNNYSGYNDVSRELYNFFSRNYPGVKFSVNGASSTGMIPGSYVDGLKPGSQVTSCNGVTYSITIAR